MSDRWLSVKLPDVVLKRLGCDTDTETDINEFIKNRLLAAPLHGDISGELRKHFTLGKTKRNKKNKKTKELTQPQIWRKSLPRLVPKTGLKYSDVKQSNSLWLQYMQEFLDTPFLKRNGFTGDPSDKHWENVSAKIIKADFHGAYLSVIRSITPGYVGIEGIVVMETLNVFQLLGKDSIVKKWKSKTFFGVLISDDIFQLCEEVNDKPLVLLSKTPWNSNKRNNEHYNTT